MATFDFFGFNNPRIDELPPGTPVAGDYIPYWDRRNGITKRLEATMLNPSSTPPTLSFEWIPNRKDVNGDPLPYNLNDVVTRGGNWYQSQQNNNTFAPGSSDTWLLMTRSYSGGFWQAGVYSDARPWVFSNHTGETQIYELIDPARPFISTNIVTEEAAGKWRSLHSKVTIWEVDTTDAVIVLDARHASQIWWRGSDNIDGPRLWQLINHERLVEAKFFFTMGGLFQQELPLDFRMSDPLFNATAKTWTPYDVGDFEATINFNGLDMFNLKIFGPYGGGGNLSPSVVNNTITYSGGILDGPRTYYDPEGDLENNPLPEVLNPAITGTPEPGSTLTATWTFFSPSGYAQGTHRYQWYRASEDGSNKEEIPGAVAQTYAAVASDDGFAISCVITAVQTAPAPANGNPESLPTETPAVLVEAATSAVPELDLDLFYDNVMDLKSGNYDTVNFRVPDTGLVNNGATYWTSPDAGSRPTYDAPNKRLVYDPSVTVRYLDGAIAASNAKGTANTRKYEFIGVIEFDTVTTSRVTIFGISTTHFFERNANMKFSYTASSTVEFNFIPVAGVKYRFRLRTDVNPTTTFLESRLQLNYDEAAGTYLFDQTMVHSQGGIGIGSGFTLRQGASKVIPPNRGLLGKNYGFALLGQAHLATDKELNLWRTLNATAGL